MTSTATRDLQRTHGGRIGLILTALLTLSAIGYGASWWFRMQHVLHVRNSSPSAVTIGVMLDNEPSIYSEAVVAPGGAATLRFRRNAEAGYIFYNVEGSAKTEVGRCGYTDKRINDYVVDVGPSMGFACKELSKGGPFPLP